MLLDLADIAINPHHVYHRAEWRHISYIAFHTGASATADIDIVLVHNAQGVRSLSVRALPRRSSK